MKEVPVFDMSSMGIARQDTNLLIFNVDLPSRTSARVTMNTSVNAKGIAKLQYSMFRPYRSKSTTPDISSGSQIFNTKGEMGALIIFPLIFNESWITERNDCGLSYSPSTSTTT